MDEFIKTPNQDGQSPVEHKRRVRYQGTHPRRYEEKYKELNPEKYQADVEKIIQQGKTPAGMHIPIMVNEILEVLAIQPGEIGMDATLGYGGHTSRMLEKLAGQGHLYATDVDSAEIVKTTARLAQKGYGPEIFTPKNMNFADIDKVAPGQKFDFVLADLGVSSMQIDNPERGFSFKTDAPLDLRLNQASGKTAAERLLELTERELIDLLVINSDEPYAEKIAKQMMIKLWRGEYIQTTKQLYATIEKALEFLPKREQKEAVKKSCQRVFQALRIDVNCEFEVLESFLEKLPYCMNEGGRVAILTFHSGEDRMVKKAFKQFKNLGIFSQISDEVIRPTPEECFKNPRAHSTKLRWAIRSDI